MEISRFQSWRNLRLRSAVAQGTGVLNDRSSGDISDTSCTHLAHNNRQLAAEDVEDAFYAGLGSAPGCGRLRGPRSHLRRGMPSGSRPAPE